jgi:heat shock transcription factor
MAGGGGELGGAFQLGRVVETTSATNSPSPAGTEEIMRTDFGESPERGTKRRRRG